MIFAYIKTLDNVHKASPLVVAYVLERKACCVSVAVAVHIFVCLGWISTCPGLCVL